MRVLRIRCLILLGLVTTCFGTVLAQDPGPQAELAGRVLEVGGHPGPTRIQLFTDRPMSFWAAAMEPLQGWKVPEEFIPVQAVNFEGRSTPEGKAEVKITLFRGTRRFREKEELIGTYSLSEGETVTATELAKYGFKPVPMRILTVTKDMSDLPALINLTTSIGAVAEPAVATLPTVLIKLTNSAGKNVLAVLMHSEVGDRKLNYLSAADSFAAVVMAPGAAYTQRFPADQPAPVRGPITVYIDAVIFDDGSFEGDHGAAGPYFAREMGRRYALTRIIAKLQEAADAGDEQSLDRLIHAIESYSATAPAGAVADVRNKFALDSRLDPVIERWIKAGDDLTRISVLNALQGIRSSTEGKREGYISHKLVEMIKFDEGWLARLPQ
jgi:hypothetical protein